MPDYEVIGGHGEDGPAEFRDHGDGRIELYSSEINPETDEETGTVGFMSYEEMAELGDVLRSVFDGDEDGVEAPELDDMVVGQYVNPLLGTSIAFIATDEEGDMDESRGAMFHDERDVIEAADAAPEPATA